MKTYTSSMKSLQLLALVAVLFAGVSCGEAPSDIEAKKSELSEYNNELREPTPFLWLLCRFLPKTFFI